MAPEYIAIVVSSARCATALLVFLENFRGNIKMKFVGYVDPKKPNKLVFLNLQEFDCIRPTRDGTGSYLSYKYLIGSAILGRTTAVPVELVRMQEIWKAADVAGDPTLSISRVYPTGTNREVYRGSAASISQPVTKETLQDLQVQASQISRMTVSLDSRTEDGKPMLTIQLFDQKMPIYAIGDFSPLVPHLVMADPSILQRMQAPAVAQIADETPPDIRQIGNGRWAQQLLSLLQAR